MTAVRLRQVRMRDSTFRDYEVWQDLCEPETVQAIDATSAAESMHREWNERTGHYNAGPTDWNVRNKRNHKVVIVRVTGEVVAEYSGVAIGGVEAPERSRYA